MHTAATGLPGKGLQHQPKTRPQAVQAFTVAADGTPAQQCTFHPARRLQNKAKTPATACPHPASDGRDPVFISHGSATQWRDEI